MKIHYSGGLKIYRKDRVTTMLRGWASCATGDRAYAIKDKGNYTEIKELVTCKTCLRNISLADIELDVQSER